jgi:peptide/nickel transport system substrate-binding protein
MKMGARWVVGMLSLLASLGAGGCKRGGSSGTAGASGATGGATAAASKAAENGVLTVCGQYEPSWVRNFNPLIAEQSSRWPTRAGVYEPLLIFNAIKGEYTPWLATEYAWSEGNKKLSFTTRKGVLWSDGAPFSAKDVVFTFQLLKKFKAADLYAVWDVLDDVKAPDDEHVEFVFKRPFVPAMFFIGHLQPIIPEHKWNDIPDPIKYTNEEPVGTGPFTEIKVFQNQVYEIGRNPHYWQPGKPYVKALRLPAYGNNDAANLALINGEIDWAAAFIPDIQKVYAGKDPEHYHYWYPLLSDTVLLYANVTRKPFDDVRVRKAISMAINREQMVRIASYNYTRPADATALSDAYTKWRDPQAIEAGTWVKYNPDEANRLLDEAGLKRGADGMRTFNGAPIHYDINVVTGWSDWVRAVQLMVQDLRKVGIDTSLKGYDYSAFFERVQKGDFDLSIGWSPTGATPYNMYRGLMSKTRYKPIGELALENWQRYTNPQADDLLAAFESTSDPDEQKRIDDKLQRLFVENAPVIPLFPNVTWGTYNTRRFTGFPDKDNAYARLPPYPAPDYLLVLTEIKPL